MSEAMVPILNGKSEHVAHIGMKICIFEEKLRFVTAIDVLGNFKLSFVVQLKQ